MTTGSIFHRSLYKWAWDTRCRNVDVARILRPLINDETTILDAGCGEYGLTKFVYAKRVVGVDIIPTDEVADEFSFIFGSIAALPFAERSFSVAASVDVMEHLPEDVRAEAVKQLVRVADSAIMIAFPCGEKARQIDEDFSKELTGSNQPIPDWLAEHLEHQYPETGAVVAEIDRETARLGRSVRTTVFYSENITVASFLRWLAVRSKYLYLLGNLSAGLFHFLLPKAKKANAYRSVILAEFEND